jgi:hypothetical protein
VNNAKKIESNKIQTQSSDLKANIKARIMRLMTGVRPGAWQV